MPDWKALTFLGTRSDPAASAMGDGGILESGSVQEKRAAAIKRKISELLTPGNKRRLARSTSTTESAFCAAGPLTSAMALVLRLIRPLIATSSTACSPFCAGDR